MNTTTLEAVCESVRYGHTESATVDPIGPKFLRITDIVPQSINWDSVPYCKIDENQLEKYKLLKGDIVVARTGATVGYAKLMREPKNAVFASYLVRFRVDCKKADPGYVGRVVESAAYKAFIWSRINGAAQPNASAPVLGSFEFQLPSLVEQKKIAAVLTNYDELIAINQRRIALLEDAARRLYREWFVHLRFPGHESVPVQDGVPQGWRKTPIAEQTSFFNRGIAPKYDDTAKGQVINQKCIRDGRISLEPARRQSKDVKPDRLVRVGDVLINSTGAGTLGRVAQVRTPIENCTVDTHVTIARPSNEYSSTYFGQALLNLEPIFSGMGKGATNQLELSRSDIGAVEIWQLPQPLHTEFHQLVGPMLEQAEQLCVANQSLEKVRDLLLPKLMSGQLDVSTIALPEAPPQ